MSKFSANPSGKFTGSKCSDRCSRWHDKMDVWTIAGLETKDHGELHFDTNHLTFDEVIVAENKFQFKLALQNVHVLRSSK